MQPFPAMGRRLLSGETSCSGRCVVIGESAIFLSDQQLLHQLFMINLFSSFSLCKPAEDQRLKAGAPGLSQYAVTEP